MAALVPATSTIGCAAMSGRETPGEHADGVTIAARVRASIVSAPGLKHTGVETMQNVVQSRGFADSARIGNRAGEAARRVSGVRDVGNDTSSDERAPGYFR